MSIQTAFVRIPPNSGMIQNHARIIRNFLGYGNVHIRHCRSPQKLDGTDTNQTANCPSLYSIFAAPAMKQRSFLPEISETRANGTVFENFVLVAPNSGSDHAGAAQKVDEWYKFCPDLTGLFAAPAMSYRPGRGRSPLGGIAPPCQEADGGRENDHRSLGHRRNRTGPAVPVSVRRSKLRTGPTSGLSVELVPVLGTTGWPRGDAAALLRVALRRTAAVDSGNTDAATCVPMSKGASDRRTRRRRESLVPLDLVTLAEAYAAVVRAGVEGHGNRPECDAAGRTGVSE